MARIKRASAEPEPLHWHITQPSQQATEARFTIGRDRVGQWVVKDREGHVGGMFVSESAAFRSAREHANNETSQVCRAPEGQVIELGLQSGIPTSIH